MGNVIGITGKKQVGKDTVASYLTLRYGYVRIGNADYLKKVATQLGWDGKKDERGRRFLQDLGMVVRQYNEDFWVNVVINTIKEAWKKDDSVRFVVPDVRFPNEASAIKGLGGLIVRVMRYTGFVDEHPSETSMDYYPADFTICNFGGFDELYKQVDSLVLSEWAAKK
jgi:hypothetical protein